MPNSPYQDNGTLCTVKYGLVTLLLNISNKLHNINSKFNYLDEIVAYKTY